jgi:hypothetical protein
VSNEGMAERTRIVELDEKKISRLDKEGSVWGMSPCDLDGDDLGVHTWLKLELRYQGERLVGEKILDCDRKG